MSAMEAPAIVNEDIVRASPPTGARNAPVPIPMIMRGLGRSRSAMTPSRTIAIAAAPSPQAARPSGT